MAYSQNSGPATYAPSSLRSSSSVRSRAASNRDAVDFASPLSECSSGKVSGSSALTTVATRETARSIAWVPVPLDVVTIVPSGR